MLTDGKWVFSDQLWVFKLSEASSTIFLAEKVVMNFFDIVDNDIALVINMQ